MKKLIFILFTLCLMQGISFAQDNMVTLRPIKKGEEPKAVMNAIKSDFPNAASSELSYLPSLIYNEKWEVTENLESNNDNYDYVTVLLKENNETYRAVYDKTGKILHTKTVIKQADLPTAIMTTIHAKYPGYSIVNDREKITTGKNMVSDIVYRVEIQKGGKGNIKSLFLNNAGQILREVGHLNL